MVPTHILWLLAERRISFIPKLGISLSVTDNRPRAKKTPLLASVAVFPPVSFQIFRAPPVSCLSMMILQHCPPFPLQRRHSNRPPSSSLPPRRILQSAATLLFPNLIQVSRVRAPLTGTLPSPASTSSGIVQAAAFLRAAVSIPGAYCPAVT